jgi:nucleotide-binding universal stress UspA family protein
MLTSQFSAVDAEPTLHRVSAKTLREWCAPDVILAVTSLDDEMVILPHAIQQARQSHAKIVLVHVVAPPKAVSVHHKPLVRTKDRLQEARVTIDRMARQLRWLGFTCDPLVLIGNAHAEIPLIARNYCADRAIITLDYHRDLERTSTTAHAEQLLPELDIPTCVIGRHASLASRSSLLTRNVTLALSLDSDCDVPLAFSCRFAQELRAKLTVLHISSSGGDPDAVTPTAIASRFPRRTWRESELFCPAEIIVHEGEAAAGILKHAASTGQDFMILCSAGPSSTDLDWKASVTYNVVARSQCPVVVLPSQPCSNSENRLEVTLSTKVSAIGDGAEGDTRNVHIA